MIFIHHGINLKFSTLLTFFLKDNNICMEIRIDNFMKFDLKSLTFYYFIDMTIENNPNLTFV